jgi:hypothetical protein
LPPRFRWFTAAPSPPACILKVNDQTINKGTC